MDERELGELAEQARAKLLACPRESVWESVQKEPVGSVFIVLLLYLFLGFPLAIVSFFVNLAFGFELWEISGFAFVYPILPPATYAAYIVRDNEKKYQTRQKHLPSALPTTIAKAYCSAFPKTDELWPAMDYLWREGQARSFGAINSMMLDSIERARQAQDSDDSWEDDDDPRSTPF